jgi:hypothetical protein
MRVATYEEIPWTRSHGLRGGNPKEQVADAKTGNSMHRRLFKGTPGKPGNFEMIVIWTQYSDSGSGRFFPRHRHPFDQLRLTLAGTPEWTPGVQTPPGSINYIPAGTWYGPYERHGGHQQLHIQFAGANGALFVDYDALIEARDALAAKGKFENGLYTWVDDNGQTQSMDGHEAGLQYASGQKQEYPPARFASPINMDPTSFAWVEVEPGVKVKELGSFTERGTRIAMLAIGDGASYRLTSPEQTTMLFVTSGTGQADGQSVREHDSMMLDQGEGGVFSSQTRLELMLLGLPKLAYLETSNQAARAALAAV